MRNRMPEDRRDAETRLWGAVTLLAVDHARGLGVGVIAKHKRADTVAEARRWLLQDRSMLLVAGMAGIDGEALRNWARQQDALGWPVPAKPNATQAAA